MIEEKGRRKKPKGGRGGTTWDIEVGFGEVGGDH